MKTTVFGGGIPWGPDVRKLLDKFGTPEPGLITHEEIGEEIGEDWRSARYRGVVSSWRKHLWSEMNIDTHAESGEGIRILTEVERVECTTRDFRGVVRKTRRAYTRGGSIQAVKLDDVSRRKHDHLMRAVGAVVTSATENAKSLTAALRSPDRLPQKKTG